MAEDIASIILITGSTGAGKSTYARALADQLGGLRFSIDDWMTTLFWMDSPQPVQFDWAIERVNRCEAMIWATAAQAAQRGVPVILDLGFTTLDQRQKFRALAAEAGLMAAVHYVDVGADERWRRVEQRNAERGDTFAMTVDRAMFDFMEARWEPPTEAEWQAAGGKRV
jgi:predicted kinase